jgi:hypothetical protein
MILKLRNSMSYLRRTAAYLIRKNISKHELEQVVVYVLKVCFSRAARRRVGVVHGDPPQGARLPHGGHGWPATEIS